MLSPVSVKLLDDAPEYTLIVPLAPFASDASVFPICA
jgi:hypothetical protein